MESQIDQIASVQIDDSSISFYIPNYVAAWRVNTFWEKEPETIRWIDSFKPSSLFIDVGANIGLYSLYAARSRGVNVLAFEPESLNYALLNKNILLNQMDQKIQAYSLAISDEITLDALHISLFLEGCSSNNFKETLDFKRKNFKPQFSQGCFSMTLDDLVQKHLIPVPQYIKIDVDGIEHRIIKGARQTLGQPELQSVLVELNTNLPEHCQIVDLMKENGFVYSQAQVDDSLSKEGAFQGVGNFIFFRS